MKRSLLMIFGVMAMVMSLAMQPTPALAATPAQDPSCGVSVIGFRPWYYGLCEGSGTNVEIISPNNDEDLLKAFIWKIVLNVTYDLLLAVGYLTLMMIVYGGYQYISSQGDVGRLAKGKKTLTSAVIGATIAMSASVIVNTASAVLGTNFNSNSITKGNNGLDVSTINSILTYAYSAAGLVAVAFIIKGGFDYILSRGDPGKTAQGTRTLIAAVIGLVIVIMARVITSLIISTTGGAV